jgi:hypothetical protein
MELPTPTCAIAATTRSHARAEVTMPTADARAYATVRPESARKRRTELDDDAIIAAIVAVLLDGEFDDDG